MWHLTIVALGGAGLIAQEAAPVGARDMYFGGFEVKTAPPARNPAPRPKAASPARKMLGLRYSIVKLTGLNSDEVPVDTRFRSGDAVRIRIQANSNGYLYIVHRGTSGDWRVLFPKPDAQSAARVEAGKEYTFPENSSFRFGGAAGVEKLFVVLSREPETSLDDALFRVRDKNRAVADPLIAGLRDSSSRGAASQDVRDGQREQAIYVVNTTLPRVVADIQLIHQ